MGVSDSTLRIARAAVAAAIAPETGGKSPDLVLLVQDMAGGTVDPAFAAHTLPIQQWASAWWQRWQAPTRLNRSFKIAVRKLRAANRTVWDVVSGPVSALVATLWRISWVTHSPCHFADDLGNHFYLQKDSPAAVAQAVQAAVRRWQMKQVMMNIPALAPTDLDFDMHASEHEHPVAAPDMTPPQIPLSRCSVHGCRNRRL